MRHKPLLAPSICHWTDEDKLGRRISPLFRDYITMLYPHGNPLSVFIATNGLKSNLHKTNKKQNPDSFLFSPIWNHFTAIGPRPLRTPGPAETSSRITDDPYIFAGKVHHSSPVSSPFSPYYLLLLCPDHGKSSFNTRLLYLNKKSNGNYEEAKRASELCMARAVQLSRI